MRSDNYIVGFSFINSQSIISNNVEIMVNDSQKNFANFSTAIFKHMKIDYPKYFKMDNLSKLGFLTAEILLNNRHQLKVLMPDEIGIVLSNHSSSLDTDLKFNDLVVNDAQYFPSPALFVYTLPNIVAGEICIRHHIKGENAFFIFEKFNPDFLNNYVHSLLNNKNTKACIAGWINLLDEDYESFLIFVENKESDLQSAGDINLNIDNLRNIYQNLHGQNH